MITRNIYVDFFKKYQDKFSNYFEEKDFNGFDFQFPSAYNHIYNELLKTSLYALTYELNEYRINNKLVGNDSSERFKYFEKIVTTKEFDIYFSNKYPVLMELMDTKINSMISFFDEILNNFINEKKEIEQVIGIRIDKITDIVLGQGDTHNNGKTVAVLHFHGQKLIYKPHSLDTDRVLSNLLEITNKYTALRLEHLKFISYSDHGWQEFKDYEEAQTNSSIKNLYIRLGNFLGLFFIMNTSDMHYENLIINRDMPYFIDTETLMVPSRFEKSNQNDVVSLNNFEDSIMLSALLPFKTRKSIMDMDLSGIFGEKIVSKKFKTMNVVDYGLDTMHIEKKLLDLVDSKQNKNRNINVFDYRDDLINGFTEILNIIINNKHVFLDFFEKSVPNDLKLRQILRPTMVYGKFLEAALNPVYLLNNEARNSLFDILLKGNESSLRVRDEISCLKQGDVPYYMSAYSNCNLYDGENHIIDQDFFVTSSKECILSKISNLTKTNLDFQVELIKLSYTSKLEKLFVNDKLTVKKRENRYKNSSLVFDIIQNIEKKKFYNQPFKSYDYAMLHLIPNESYIGGLNISLYEGIGMLLTLMYHRRLNNENMDDLESMINTLELNYKLDTDTLSYSVFDGKGSLVYLFYNAYKLSGKRDFYEKSLVILSEIVDDLKKTNELDFMYGLSGILVLLNNMNEDENSIVLKQYIHDIGYLILNLLDKNNLETIGYAHGLTGIAYAILLTYKTIDDQKFYNYAVKLIKKENLLMLNEKINVGWCRGYSGILLARSQMKPLMRLADIKWLDINKLTQKFIEEFYDVKSFCLCHGLFGNIMIASKLIKDRCLKEEFQEKLKSIVSEAYFYIDNIENIPLGLNNNYQIDGLMLGTSGIAYALMYIENNIPLIFNLEVYKEV